jgi:hypothetical protein
MRVPAVRAFFHTMSTTCAIVTEKRHGGLDFHDAAITVVSSDGVPLGACRRHERRIRASAARGIFRHPPLELLDGDSDG